MIVYVSAIFIAFLSSLNSFRLDFPFHFKVFSILLGLTFLVELTASLGIMVMHASKNHWLYNSFMLLEFPVYAFFYSRVVTKPEFRKVMFFFIVAFPIYWLVTVLFVFGINTWNSYVILGGSFFTVLWVLMYYYELVMVREVQSLRNQPEFWIATGMLIYYLGILPFYGMLNFLVKYNIKIANAIWQATVVMDTIMYLLFSYAYICRSQIARKSL